MNWPARCSAGQGKACFRVKPKSDQHDVLMDLRRSNIRSRHVGFVRGDGCAHAIAECPLLHGRFRGSTPDNRKPCSIAPWQVVRAEEYIEANWNSVLTIKSLAEAIGASARSIFLSFQKARGYSPMAFAKMKRLRHARRKLSAPEADTTVTGVALECGFQNTGHFAMSYRKHFGKSLSETLRMAKARG